MGGRYGGSEEGRAAVREEEWSFFICNRALPQT